MYNLLKQQQHYSPFTGAMPMSSASPPAVTDAKFKEICSNSGGKIYVDSRTGWARCEKAGCRCPKELYPNQNLPPKCGDGLTNVFFAYCPQGKKCSGLRPTPLPCICDSCPMAYKLFPSPTLVYNNDGQATDCGYGKQIQKPVCSYKNDMRYCAKSYDLPETSRYVTVKGGCKVGSWEPFGKCGKDCKVNYFRNCYDSANRRARPDGVCYTQNPSNYTKIDYCVGGDCRK